ncbi:MAG: DUF1033 family protein [Lysinibacillus sp.]
MYAIIYMKADYEPWWKFDGWESNIVSTDYFETKEQYEPALQKTLTLFRNTYENEQSKEGKYWSFWSEEECFYCEACDDDAQVYHGIIVVEPK